MMVQIVAGWGWSFAAAPLMTDPALTYIGPGAASPCSAPMQRLATAIALAGQTRKFKTLRF